ncbi:hypothetical protein FQN54_004067 [Arachnomyces sp. PD_36]|nr:hypothetical protein FQN54_004067 [Arachnomyces sp. PD_36]
MAQQEPPFALITGCSSGIGKALATTFASKGITVLATARRTESLASLITTHPNIEAFPLTLDDPKSIEALKDAITERTGGRLDYLVNNAGTHYAAMGLDLEMDRVATLFQVNVFAVMRLCQMFTPHLRKSGRGRIVQIGSVTRDVPVVWQGAYNATKAALSQYSKTLRLELAPFNVEVVEVVTGFVQSNLLSDGLIAPEGTLYLPIKPTIEDIKLGGNKNGMSAESFAKSVVDTLLRKRGTLEIWEGGSARFLRWVVNLLPLRLFNWILFRRFKLGLLTSSNKR